MIYEVFQQVPDISLSNKWIQEEENEEAGLNLHHVARDVVEGDGKVTHPTKAGIL